MPNILAKKFLFMKRCPQCSIANPTLEFEAVIFDRHSLYPKVDCWFCYKCATCQDLVSAKSRVEKAMLTNTTNFAKLLADGSAISRIMPDFSGVEDDIPDRARSYLSQAISSLHAPDGAVMLAGSSIDAMLKEKGYLKGSVYDRIKEAVEGGVLTEGMAEWAHAVRIESNNPRHADLEDPHCSVEQAETTIAFTKALGEFLFVLPAKIERGKIASKKLVEAATGTPSA